MWRQLLQEKCYKRAILLITYLLLCHMSLQFLYQTGERKKEKKKTQNKQKPKQTTKVQLSILTNLSSEPIWITFEQPSMCNFIQTQKNKKTNSTSHVSNQVTILLFFFFFKCTVAGLKETALPFHVRIQNTNLHLG